MKRKSLLTLLLALALCLGLAACGNKDESGNQNAPDGSNQEQNTPEEPEDTFPAAPIGTELGAGIADLTFTDCSGAAHSLYETLQEKKMVLINIWATWCGPCRSEFPYMEMAYEAYKDDIEIFALSCEEGDTDEIIADFAADMGLTFPMGRDTAGLGDAYVQDGIPTTLIVDRFGTICFLETGSITSAETFATLFDIFTADDYAESQVLTDGVPKKLPDVEPADPADLAAALGGGVACSNPEDEYNWPMQVEGDHIVSSNAGQGSSVSAVDVEVTASAGDVFAVDYLTSTESGYDYMTVYVNGEMVKAMSGQRDWATFAYRLDADGTYTVTLAYEKDAAYDDGSDAVSFKNARVLSGSEAEALLASMPVYPYSGETGISVTTPGAREVIVSDDANTFADVKWYIIPGDTASFTATLAEGLDAESAAVYTYFDDSTALLADCVSGDHYEISSGIDTYEATGSGFSYVELTPSLTAPYITIYFVKDEANLNAVMAYNFIKEDGTIAATWRYADGSAPETAAVSAAEGLEGLEEGSALYYLSFVDQNGDPVEGVMANICDDATCTQMTTGANGMLAFSFPGFAYHVQIIKVPDGYEYDLTTETYLDAAGGVTEFVLTKQ